VIVAFGVILGLAVPVAMVVVVVLLYRKMDRIERKVDSIERELKQRE
jgi:hypothetical protein